MREERGKRRPKIQEERGGGGGGRERRERMAGELPVDQKPKKGNVLEREAALQLEEASVHSAEVNDLCVALARVRDHGVESGVFLPIQATLRDVVR